MELSAARVFVRDLPEAQRFYGSPLELPLRAGGADHGYRVFLAGSLQLVVEHVPPEAPEEDQVLVGRFTGLSFAVPSVEDEYNRLRAGGVPFTSEPEVQPWGGVLATLRDPSGSQLKLVQAPSAA